MAGMGEIGREFLRRRGSVKRAEPRLGGSDTRVSSFAAAHNVPMKGVARLRSFLLSDYDEVTRENVEEVLLACLEGLFVVGTCVACSVAASSPGGAFALAVCSHMIERSEGHKFLLLGDSYTTTAAEGDGLSSAARILREQLGISLPSREVVQMVAAIAAAGANPDSKLAAVSAVISFVNGVLAKQLHPFEAGDIVAALMGGLLDTTAGEGCTFDDVTGALLRGYLPDTMPVWLGSFLSLAGKLLGLSVAASITDKLMPKHVLDFCMRAHITPGDLGQHIIDMAKDLVQRCQASWDQKSFEPLWSTCPKAPVLRSALSVIEMDAFSVPGDGEGYALINSRVAYVDKVFREVEAYWKAAEPGAPKLAALRILTALEARRAVFMAAWFGPEGRPRPINIGIHGPPGIGKSKITDLVAECVLAAFGLPVDSSMKFSKNANFRFWDGFDMRLHRVVILDEVGAGSKDKADVATYEDALKLMGEASFVLPMADLNLMGKAYASHFGTILASNVPDFGVEGVLVAPAAFMRRFAVKIEVEAHPTCRRFEGSSEIDPDILSKSGLDTVLWAGKIFLPIVGSATAISWRRVGSFTTRRELATAIAPFLRARVAGNNAYTEGAAAGASATTALCRSLFDPPKPNPFDLVFEPEMGPLQVELTAGPEAVSDPDAVVEQTFVPRPIPNWDVAMDRLSRQVRSCARASYVDCLFWGHDWERSARGALAWFFVAAFFLSWTCFVVAAGIAARAYSTFWIHQLHMALDGAKPPPGLHFFESWLSYGLGFLVGFWIAPWDWRFRLAAYAIPRVGVLRLAQTAGRIRQLESAKPVLAVVISMLCVYAGGKLLARGREWWSPKPTASPPEPVVVHTTVTSAERMSYADLRESVLGDPVNWVATLRANPPKDDSSWVDAARARIGVGIVPRELIPRAPTGEGVKAAQDALRAGTFKVTVYGIRDGVHRARHATAFALGGCYYLMPHHAAHGCEGLEIQLHARDQSESGILNKRIPLLPGVNCARLGEQDAMVMNIPGVPRTSVLRWFSETSCDRVPSPGTKAHILRPCGSAYQWETTATRTPGELRSRAPIGGHYAAGLILTLEAPSEPEMSGAPCILAAGSGGSICGIVVANVLTPDGHQRAVVNLLTKQEVEAGLRAITPSSSGYVNTSGVEFDVPPSDAKPHIRSWLGSIEQPRFAILGYARTRANYRYDFARNPLSVAHAPLQAWTNANGGGEFVVPAFKGFVGLTKGGEYKWLDPQRCKTEGMRGDTYFPPELAAAAGQCYLDRLPADLRIPGQACGPLSPEEAVFGSERVAPLDLNKSAGAIGGLKFNHVDVANKQLSPRLAAEVACLEASIRAGDFKASRMRSTLKGETRKVDKALAGMTRHIAPVDFALMIVQRRFLAPLVATLIALGVATSTMAIGINAADPRQWADLGNYAKSASEDGKVGDGDLGEMDLNVQLDLIQQEASVLGNIARRSGYSEEDANIVEVLVYNGSFNITDVDGVIILRAQGRDSGEYATDVRNCLQTFFKLFCAYHLCARLVKIKPPDFNKAVSPTELGDDHVYGAKQAIRSWFNSVTIAAVLKPYGDRYTNAAKSDDTADDYKPLTRASFLGRTWRAVGPLWAAPLDLNRCAKSSNIVMLKKNVNMSVLCESIAANIQHELVMHGPGAFASYQAALPQGPVVLADGSSCKPKRWDYEELFERWSRGLLVTWDSGGQAGWSGVTYGPDAPLPVVYDEDYELTSGEAIVQGADESVQPDVHEATAQVVRAETVRNVADGTAVPRAPTAGALEDWYKRIVDIQTIDMTSLQGNTSSGGFFSLQLLKTWMANVFVNRHVANNRYLRNARIRLHVQIGSTPQHRGGLAFGILPTTSSFRANGSGGTYVNQVVQLNGVSTNLSGPISFEMDFPLTTPCGVTCLDLTTDVQGGTEVGPKLLVGVLSPLTHASLATAPTVSIKIRMCLPQAEFYSPTDITAYTVTSSELRLGPSGWVRDLTREGVEPNPGPGSHSVAAESTTAGLVSRPAMIVAALLSKFKGTPIAAFTEPASLVARGIAGVAALFGYGRPALRESSMPMYMSGNQDLGRAIGVDALAVGDMDPAAASSPFPGAAGWSSEDQMQLEWLSKIPSLVMGSSCYSEWLTTAGAGTTLACIPVCPASLDTGADGSGQYVFGPVMVIGSCYSYWRGTAVFKVVVFSGSMDGGRLRLSWIPATGAVTGTLDPLQRYSSVIDLEEGTQLTLKVGFQGPTPILPMPLRFADCPKTAYTNATFTQGFNNGVLKVSVDSALVSNQASTGVGVKIFQTWEDLVFYRQQNRMLQSVVLTSGEYELTSGEVLDMVPGHGDPREAIYCASGAGVHLRPVLTRYHLQDVTPLVKLAVGTTEGANTYTWPSFGWGDEGSIAAVNSQTPLRYHTPFDFASKCYSVVRGASKHRFIMGCLGGPTTPVLRTLYAATTSCWEQVPGTTPNYMTATNGAGGTSALGAGFSAWRVMNTINAVSAIDDVGTSAVKADDATLWGIVVPFNSASPWVPTFADFQQGLTPANAFSTAGPVAQIGFSYVNGGAAQPGWSLEHWSGYGDDVVFHGFVGCPVMAAQLWPI